MERLAALSVAAIARRVAIPYLAAIPLRLLGRFRLGSARTALVVCGRGRFDKMFAKQKANSLAGLLRVDAAGAKSDFKPG